MSLWAALLIAGLFGSVAASLRFGWLVGRRRMSDEGRDANEGLGTVDGAIFGLMGLLVAFTFTGAATRFEHRRDLIIEEVNAIGTAWLRLDLLPQAERDASRELMRTYLDQRIESYRRVTDTAATAAAIQRTQKLQSDLWAQLQSAIRAAPAVPIAQTVMPSFNDMFDIASTRILATEQHPPMAIYALLMILVLVSAFLAGFGQAKAARQSMLHLLGFAATTTVALYLILDLEYPRLGLIRVDAFDQAMVDLREGMR
ncbi:MAG TPA: hypothetical protein PKE27_02155 [Povalibacter sp.]|uniref:bestrophin-like domain n=1 Tax=Povalibacter sp. TaxID=1962978 RepID=UPI002B90C8E8|nr:hypothetical protein [Povalibacter sp.]HMN43344.1 hypothetical protein [Povalibacter sp.]